MISLALDDFAAARPQWRRLRRHDPFHFVIDAA
jgi:hypothetical protein